MCIDEAIKIATREVQDRTALIYLFAIPQAIEQYGSDGFRTQLVYALANMSTWRGENARQVKIVFRSYLKAHK